MERRKWMKPMRVITLMGLFFIVSSFQRDEVISGDLSFLIGDYDFICTFDDGKKIEPNEVNDKYTIKITKKSEMVVYKNGKKLEKYSFSDVRVPLLDEHDYVMFYKKDQNYPLFYKGDTIVMHITPFEFSDNYFQKRR